VSRPDYLLAISIAILINNIIENEKNQLIRLVFLCDTFDKHQIIVSKQYLYNNYISKVIICQKILFVKKCRGSSRTTLKINKYSQIKKVG